MFDLPRDLLEGETEPGKEANTNARMFSSMVEATPPAEELTTYRFNYAPFIESWGEE